jgi:hypothetical protein
MRGEKLMKLGDESELKFTTPKPTQIGGAGGSS